MGIGRERLLYSWLRVSACGSNIGRPRIRKHRWMETMAAKARIGQGIVADRRTAARDKHGGHALATSVCPSIWQPPTTYVPHCAQRGSCPRPPQTLDTALLQVKVSAAANIFAVGSKPASTVSYHLADEDHRHFG